MRVQIAPAFKPLIRFLWKTNDHSFDELASNSQFRLRPPLTDVGQIISFVKGRVLPCDVVRSQCLSTALNNIERSFLRFRQRKDVQS